MTALTRNSAWVADKTKLEQETWLCRTHLDDFLVKIWTILDHTRPRLNLVIKTILLNLWSIFFRPFRTIWKHWRPRGCMIFFCPERFCDFFVPRSCVIFLSKEVAWLFLFVLRGCEFPCSQFTKFPSSQVSKIPRSQDPSSKVPKFPSIQVPKLPSSQVTKLTRSQVPKFPSSQVTQLPSLFCQFC